MQVLRFNISSIINALQLIGIFSMGVFLIVTKTFG